MEHKFLTDLRNGKTLQTLHDETGECQSFQWDECRETVFVHSWNKNHPERGVRTSCESWTMGTLQLPFRKKHEAFSTNY